MHVGASTVLLEKAGPTELLEAIVAHRATVLFTAPTSYRAMAAGARERRIGVRDGGTLRKCVSAGEALPAATRTLWREATGIEMIDGIGATEMLHIFISADEAQARPGATGKAMPGYRAAWSTTTATRSRPARSASSRCRAPPAAATSTTRARRTTCRDGWNYTGDAYLMDADGYFHYQSRTDDMIISAGYNIAAPEVEEVLLRHAAVAECAVIGVPDAERGQIVKAFVVLRGGHARRRGDGEGAAGLREGDGGAVQVPAGGRVPRGVAADGDGEAAAVPVAGIGAGLRQLSSSRDRRNRTMLHRSTQRCREST